MIFGNLSTGTEIFEGSVSNGNWTPAKEYALVKENTGNTKAHTYTYALYKVSFENVEGGFDNPEWRIYGEGKVDVMGSNDLYTYDNESTSFTISSADGENALVFPIPYIATYATEAEGLEALAEAVPTLGCRDKTATNYDYTATLDDGTCTYPAETDPPLITGTILAGSEVSALIILG